MSDTDIAQRKLGELVNEMTAILNEKCERDIQLIVAVLRDSLFQHELMYRVQILDAIEEQRKTRTVAKDATVGGVNP